jgi:hypothetical protein
MGDLYIPNHPRKEAPSLPPLSDAHRTSYQWVKHGFSLCWTVDWTSLLVQLMTCEQIGIEIMSNLCNKIQQNFVETEFFWTKQNNLGWTYVVDPMEKPIPIQVLPQLNGELGIFFSFFLGSQNKPFDLFVCEWTLDMFSMPSPKACSTRLRCVKLPKFIRDMNHCRARQTSYVIKLVQQLWPHDDGL